MMNLIGKKDCQNENEQLYNVVPKLWHVGEVVPKELYFFKKIDYGMLQPKHIVDYPIYFYEHQLRKVVDIIVKIFKNCWLDSDN